MNKFWGLVLIIVSAVSAATAQSGRRPAQVETSAQPATVEKVEYSESKPVEKPHFYRRPARGKRPGTDADAKGADEVVQTAGADGEETEVVKVETDLVTIPVSVFDRNGLYIPNLSKEEFKIFEDNVEQQIAYFGTSEKPFTVILLLDTSPSTEYKIEEIQDAAIAFVDQLKPHDRVMVIEFDANVHVLAEPTGDRERIYKAIKKADFGGGTSLYDAVNYSLSKKLSLIDGRKAIVLFTDGVDTTSRKADYDSTLALAEEADAMIFPIYYNTYLENLTGGSVSIGLPLPGMRYPAPGTTAKEYALGKKYLEDLSLMTGGRVFRPESTPGGLTTAFKGIAEELRRQYNIGYVPNTERTPGRKTIKVRVNRPNLVLRARDSYIVP